MTNVRVAKRRVLGAILCVSALICVPARGQGQSAVLAEAIDLFETGKYLEAQEKLIGLDRSRLTAQQQVQRDDYVNRVQVAITLHEKALRDLEDAETALTERDDENAERLLRGAIDNEYAAEAVRRAAEAYLRDLRERTALVEEESAAGSPHSATPDAGALEEPQPAASAPLGDAPATRPTSADVERARASTQAGEELLRVSRYEQAREQFETALTAVPGYPEAVDGLARLRHHEENVAGVLGVSLAERLRRKDAINWQRTVVQYRDAERIIREHVVAERFEQANQMMARARQVVEAGKQFADPITQYDRLRHELDALIEEVRSKERVYHEHKVAETRREVEQQRSRRLREIEEKRTSQVEALMEQAQQQRKDGDLAGAINVLRQAIVINPKYSPARWMLDILEDQRQYRGARQTRKMFYEKMRGALDDVERAKVPWFEELNYPKNWLDITTRPGRSQSGDSREDRLLLGALDQRIPVDFNGDPFDQVIQRFVENHQLNISVTWHDLKRAGVDSTTPIHLDLPREITLKKALTEVLDQAGGGEVELGFDVADGVITVATRALLDRKTYPQVYDVADLLMEVPNLTDYPEMDLNRVRPHRVTLAEQADMPWRYGDDDDDEPEHDAERLSRVRQLTNLIEDTVAPQSWRDHGGSIGTIKEINNQLVITQNSAAHRRISGLLDKLREERAIQIAVEALFITVSSNYVEELGMDLDIVLNNGNAGFDFLSSGLGPVTDPVLGSRVVLPRTFSRLGFTPNTPALGTALPAGNVPLSQPFGVPGLVPASTGGGGSSLTPVPVLSNILDFTNPINLSSDVPGSFAGQTVGPALNLFGSFLDNIQVDFLIRATQADSRSSVLTAPRIVVFNGGSAWVAVTIQQNFISQLTPVVAQGAVAQAPLTATINAGASLFVRATVTADKRYVMMLIAPGVTRLLSLQSFQFSGGTGAGQAFVQLPTLSAQRLQTMVSVPDGGTLLVGGQKLGSEIEVESGVPILSKIPILKRMYSARATVKDEQTLLILIKPKILIHAEQEELAFPSFSQG